MENHKHSNITESKLKTYQPLIVILTLIFLSALALQYSMPDTNWLTFMHSFMGLFFVIFAMFKLFDLSGFADGFQMYDILAKKDRRYAYAYPFIELGLGLLYLSSLYPTLTNFLTVIVMSVSAVGVIKSIRSGMNITCACLGTVLNVPLSTVSVIENVGMGIMAALTLFIIS